LQVHYSSVACLGFSKHFWYYFDSLQTIVVVPVGTAVCKALNVYMVYVVSCEPVIDR